MSVLRILCFNIHGGYNRKRQRVLKRIHTFMNSLNVDIAVIQEMETRPSRGGGGESDITLLAGPDRPHTFFGKTLEEAGGWYGNLIVSRYPIVRTLVHDLETKPAMEPRNAIDAVIDSPHSKLRIIGTHLSLSSKMRWAEINNLIRLIKAVEDESPYPVFLMGDFNEWSRSSKLIQHLDTLMVPLPCGKTFPSFMPVFKLDRVWCSHAQIKASAMVIRTQEARELSDHLPVLVDITALPKSIQH